jgi:hypothetical protein
LPNGKKEPLPPLPVAPRRSLTPPAQRALSGVHVLDAKTPPRAKATAQLGAVVSVFEELSEQEREDYALIGHYLKGCPQSFRLKVIEALRIVFELEQDEKKDG